MTNEELKEGLRYAIKHGLFRAYDAGMKVSFPEILNRIEELEDENRTLEATVKLLESDSDVFQARVTAALDNIADALNDAIDLSRLT